MAAWRGATGKDDTDSPSFPITLRKLFVRSIGAFNCLDFIVNDLGEQPFGIIIDFKHKPIFFLQPGYGRSKHPAQGGRHPSVTNKLRIDLAGDFLNIRIAEYGFNSVRY